jgi:cyanophycinase
MPAMMRMEPLMSPGTSGPLALVGSGEYTPAMDTTDRMVLEQLGGAARALVALIPTASALEPGMPERWNARGAAHFAALGAQVAELLLLSRAAAAAPQLLATLQRADFCYFSGGSPDHCVETLHDTPAWATIMARHATGAALAGCSAGAMMLGGYTVSVRAMRAGGEPRWRPALGLLPQLAIMPHFDRMRGFVGADTFAQLIAAAPPGVTLVGVDEDTALVRLPGAGWLVSGRQSVSVFAASGQPTIYHAGDPVPL